MSGIYVNSSGTSGNNKLYFKPQDVSNHEVKILKPIYYKIINDYGVKKIANCLPAGNLWDGYTALELLSSGIDVISFPLSATAPLETVIDYIEKFKIDTIVAAPSYIESLLEHRNKANLTSLKLILYVGELFLDKTIKRWHQQIGPVNVKGFIYGGQDFGVIGYQCIHSLHNEYHVIDDTKIEITEESEIIVSNYFTKRVQAKDKYSTGDIGKLEDKVCQCGFVGKHLILGGRLDKYQNVLGYNIIFSTIRYIIDHDIPLEATDADIQMLILQNELSERVIIILINKEWMPYVEQIERNIKNNLTLSILIKSTKEFKLKFINHCDFFKTEVSGKKMYFVPLTFDKYKQISLSGDEFKL